MTLQLTTMRCYSSYAIGAASDGALAVIIVNDPVSSMVTPIAANSSQYAQAPIPVCMVSYEDGQMIMVSKMSIDSIYR